MTERRIAKVFKSRPTIEGAGVHLKRAFGYSQVPQFDPFLMLDDFHTANPAEYLAGFPWHPHRGIETITYVLQGLVEHGDSMGNKGVITPGDVQWMTAGSGIIHQEMPKESPTGMMWGFQFWANLPAKHKMMAPRYREVKAADIPEVTLESGVVIKVICGEVSGVKGPVRDIVIDPEMLDVSVPAGGTLHATRSSPAIRPSPMFWTARGISTIAATPLPTRWRGRAGWMSPGAASAAPETVVLYERDGEASDHDGRGPAAPLPVHLGDAPG